MPPKTFMDISGYPHYENVISNILQFFMSPEEEHNFQHLFIQSLINCINKKGDNKLKVSKSIFVVEREAPGLQQTRIDILVTSRSEENESEGFAIIIECKIWAALYNNLNNYWDAIKQKNKVGVILSLQKESNINHPGFINITYEDYSSEIMRNVGEYMLNASDKYITFLKDFLINLTTLKLPKLMANYYQFYYENLTKINDLAKMRDDVTRRLLSGIVNSGKQNNYHVTNTRAESYRCWLIEERNDIFFTLLIDTTGSIANNSIKIFLEIQSSLFNTKEVFTEDPLLTEIANNEGFEIGELYNGGSFMHIMSKSYELNLERITNLEEHLSAINQKSLVPIYERVVAILKSKSI